MWVGFALRIVFFTDWKIMKWFAVCRNKLQECKLIKFWWYNLLKSWFFQTSSNEMFWFMNLICKSPQGAVRLGAAIVVCSWPFCRLWTEVHISLHSIKMIKPVHHVIWNENTYTQKNWQISFNQT